ncbi:MAG: phosphate/phosphite/phosphonate ABC transporter substrate-binding protein [Desulfobacteria bacterium]
MFRSLIVIIKKLNKGLAIGVVCVCLLVASSYADEARKHIAIAVFPCSDVVRSFTKFYPLITYLKHETGFDIRLVVPKDFAEFERGVKHGDINFAFQDPRMYVEIAGLYDKDSLIRSLTLEGAAFQSGVLIAAKDSSINKVEDLKGRVVMFGPRLSAARWLAAKLLFEESGIDLDKDLKSYSNGGCCEDIAFSIYLKRVDAGVVCDHFLDEHSQKQEELGIETEQIIVISRTRLVPTRVFAARRNTSNNIVAKISQALLRLDKKNPEYAKVLCRAELGGFEKSKDEDYDNLRLLMGTKPID